MHPYTKKILLSLKFIVEEDKKISVVFDGELELPKQAIGVKFSKIDIEGKTYYRFDDYYLDAAFISIKSIKIFSLDHTSNPLLSDLCEEKDNEHYPVDAREIVEQDEHNPEFHNLGLGDNRVMPEYDVELNGQESSTSFPWSLLQCDIL